MIFLLAPWLLFELEPSLAFPLSWFFLELKTDVTARGQKKCTPGKVSSCCQITMAPLIYQYIGDSAGGLGW